jgi:hypothetical protein
MIGLAHLIPYFAKGCMKEPGFFGLKPWYHYLDSANVDGFCEVKFNALPSTGRSDFLFIALAVVDDMLRIAGLIAIGVIIYGGILYTTSQGNADQTRKAYGTIINGLVGLMFCILSIAIVTFIGKDIG